MQSSSIVIFGGGGFVGRSLAEQLVRGGVRHILVPTRRLDHAKHLTPLPGVEVVQADVHDDAQLMRCISGRDAVVNTIAQLHGSDASFTRTHIELPRRIAHACERAGVPRLVHISALGVTDAAGPSRYLRSKAAGEQALRDVFGPHVTMLRPSLIFGARDQLTRLFAGLQRLAPVVPLAGADARVQPVWVEDVAGAIVRCLEDRSTAGKVYECAGPDVMTLAQLVRACGRVAGVERPIIPVPGPVARVQAWLFEHLPGEPMITRDNLDSLSVPNIASGTLPGLEALGIRPASFDQIVPTYLRPGAGVSRLDAWRAVARRQ
jgi:NADH dehydrogenase